MNSPYLTDTKIYRFHLKNLFLDFLGISGADLAFDKVSHMFLGVISAALGQTEPGNTGAEVFCLENLGFPA